MKKIILSESELISVIKTIIKRKNIIEGRFDMAKLYRDLLGKELPKQEVKVEPEKKEPEKTTTTTQTKVEPEKTTTTTQTKVEPEKTTTTPKVKGSLDAILIGGLDYRAGDFKIDQQVEMIKKSIGSDKNVKGFRYNTPTSTILETMKVNPLVPVFMFSAGCSKANEIANGPMANKLKIFIIEPYNLSVGTRLNVQAAVSSGVPAKNVFVGPDAGRGKGIVSGESSSQSPTHWGALEKIGNLVKI